MFSSFLEQTPYDVLQHIAYLGAEPGFALPEDLSRLLATCRALYDGLNIHASPHLYAAIFKLKYTNTTSHGLSTDSSLATELVRRCRALRRCFHVDLSIDGLHQDLWTLLWLVVEEGPCAPLAEAGFPKFVVELALYYLGKDTCARDELQSLVIWLLCLGFTRQDILSQTPDVRGALLKLLRPLVSIAATRESPFTSPPPSSAFHPAVRGPANVGTQALLGKETARSDTRLHARSLPPPTDAAIILTFALKEAVPLQIPYHLPATRIIAAAENRSGPTAEDYTAFQQAGTVLFSDIRAIPAPVTPFNSVQADWWISDVLNARGLPDKRVRCLPGMLTGVWEGSMMISSCVSLLDEDVDRAAPSDFLCRTPMQCEFLEYLCRTPCKPRRFAPKGRTALRSCDVPRDPEGFANLAYRKFTPGEDFQHESDGPAVDHVLIGQTLQDHEDAWGPEGFNFAGRVHDDGLIVFTREAKNDESETAETWVFEGHLRYGTALVGTFRSSLSEDHRCAAHGIFSLRKRPVQ